MRKGPWIPILLGGMVAVLILLAGGFYFLVFLELSFGPPLGVALLLVAVGLVVTIPFVVYQRIRGRRGEEQDN